MTNDRESDRSVPWASKGVTTARHPDQLNGGAVAEQTDAGRRRRRTREAVAVPPRVDHLGGTGQLRDTSGQELGQDIQFVRIHHAVAVGVNLW